MKNEKETANWMFILGNLWTIVFYLCYMFQAPNFPAIPLVSFNPFQFSVFIFYVVYWYLSIFLFIFTLIEIIRRPSK